MYPILYESIKTGTVPAHNGLGVLSDCSSCIIEQERNGKYELVMEYPMNGIHAEDIGYRRIIKAKPNFTDAPQLFRIDRIGKVMKNGMFTVYGKHISYDLSGFMITSGTANNAASACLLLERATELNPNDQTEKYSITTDKDMTADFTIKAPGSVKSFFGGKEGSFLDVFGPVEIKYNNFNVQFLLHAGADRGQTIRYGKNLLELSQEIDGSNLYTHVVCFFKQSEGPSITGDAVATGLTLDVPKTLILDVTQDYQEAPTAQELTNKAASYISQHNLTVPSNNITLDFVQSEQLTERVDLCDTVSIYYEALGITRAQAKCIRTKWDCLREKYTETEFGDVKTSLEKTIISSTAEVAEAKSDAEEAKNAVGSKKRVFIDTPVPPYDEGDLWTDTEDLYVCINPKDSTITGTASGAAATFTTPIKDEPNLLKCLCTIPADENGFTSITITQYDEDDEPVETYTVDFDETLTQGGTYDALTGILTRTDTTTKQLDANVFKTIEGEQTFSHDLGGNITVEYYIKGFEKSDWVYAADNISQSKLEDAINEATSLITGTTGGYITIHQDEDGHPYEILIMDSPDMNEATNVLRLNQKGLGFSSKGYEGPYTDAITGSGIVADAITAGSLDASRVTIQHLTATMFEGGKLTLGGLDNQSGTFELLNDAGVVIGEMDKNGLKFYGAGPEGQRPYVLLNNEVGFAGFDANDVKLFWVSRDEFHMEKCVAEKEITACNRLRFIPITITNGNTIINDGVAIVALI